ncbi:guanylate kinase [Liquorilactobacillus uvarum]|uniref:guanylate kinase n=1 Tax=Liquorilactobacillus uvarum TaxID=303240 RepID=UPI00288C2790|nr:guanylate kinase [Liquorilactobacillus uvarum]
MKHLLIICGASGAGKTTIQNYLINKHRFERVITHTTRPKRADEIDGSDYYFETEASFFKNDYFEYVKYDHSLYGSSREGLERAWRKSAWAVIVLDTAGALTYRKKLKESLMCWYIYVSNRETLIRRLKDRDGGCNAATQRLSSSEARRDMDVPDQLKDFCVHIRNDNWKKTEEKIAKTLIEEGYYN